jgi:uncharacterized protein (TIGR04551 family)
LLLVASLLVARTTHAQETTRSPKPAPSTRAGEQVDTESAFSSDWWSKARPALELHGYFRTRAELFHNFSLGRHSSSLLPGGDPQYLWPIPLDQSYTQVNGSPGQTVAVCGANGRSNCSDQTQSGANLRLRLSPEIHISDNLRVLSQLDLLDNLVLGSTPDAYAMQPASGTATSPTGYVPAQGLGGYAGSHPPISAFTTTQGPPTAGVNGWTNSIAVKRAWAEYVTPVGELRFGRMPQQWGLGMVANAGDGIDSDYQSTVDRIMLISGVKPLDLSFGAAWDFVSVGPTSANPFDVYGGQPYGTCNSCNVNEAVAFVARRATPEAQRLRLARGELVLNGGIYAAYRWQDDDIRQSQVAPNGAPLTNTPTTADYSSRNGSLEPRQFWALTPDLWVQALWRKLRFELEAVTVQGQIGYSTLSQDVSHPVRVQQYGLATQTEYRALDDKLDLQFGFGWASGDAYAYNAGPNGTTVGALQPGGSGLQGELTAGGYPAPISTFRFHPDYRVDLIFFRNILSRVEGAYYFRPSVDYDFVRHPDGEKLGGGAALIWSRASQVEQTPGHQRDLGVELDLQLYYQSKDGSLNDDPSKIGGFFVMLQYGVFFPLAGLGYLPSEAHSVDASLSAAQTARLFLGVVF